MHPIRQNIVDCVSVWTLRIPWIFTETVFCKYLTRTKSPCCFWTLTYSGPCSLREAPPTGSNIKGMVTEYTMFKRKCNPLYSHKKKYTQYKHQQIMLLCRIIYIQHTIHDKGALHIIMVCWTLVFTRTVIYANAKPGDSSSVTVTLRYWQVANERRGGSHR